MRPAYIFILAALSLIQPGCGTQAQRAVAEAALFTAIEVAGAAMQAAADSAAERDASQRARLRATPVGNWSLVRATDDDNVDSECEPGNVDEQRASDCQNLDDSTPPELPDERTPSTADESARIGGCMVCE